MTAKIYPRSFGASSLGQGHNICQGQGHRRIVLYTAQLMFFICYMTVYIVIALMSVVQNLRRAFVIVILYSFSGSHHFSLRANNVH